MKRQGNSRRTFATPRCLSRANSVCASAMGSTLFKQLGAWHHQLSGSGPARYRQGRYDGLLLIPPARTAVPPVGVDVGTSVLVGVGTADVLVGVAVATALVGVGIA